MDSTDKTKTHPFRGVFLVIRRRATLPGPGWVQVPSLLVGLTSVFGMGTGVSPPLGPPASYNSPCESRGRGLNRWLRSNQYTMRTRHDCLHYSAHTSNLLLATIRPRRDLAIHEAQLDGRSIGRLVWLGSRSYDLYTYHLSTSSSRRVL